MGIPISPWVKFPQIFAANYSCKIIAHLSPKLRPNVPKQPHNCKVTWPDFNDQCLHDSNSNSNSTSDLSSCDKTPQNRLQIIAAKWWPHLSLKWRPNVPRCSQMPSLAPSPPLLHGARTCPPADAIIVSLPSYFFIIVVTVELFHCPTAAQNFSDLASICLLFATLIKISKQERIIILGQYSSSFSLFLTILPMIIW